MFSIARPEHVSMPKVSFLQTKHHVFRIDLKKDTVRELPPSVFITVRLPYGVKGPRGPGVLGSMGPVFTVCPVGPD